MKVYAYVKSESCAGVRAFRPGEEYQGQPVSRHGDLYRWTYGKRATLDMIENGSSPYMRRSAGAVAYLLNWR